MIALQAIHWFLALVPVLVLLALFVWFDAFKLMNLREILLLLLLGGLGALASYPVSGRLLDTLPIGFSNYSRFWAPWIEEAIKGVLVVILFRLNRIGFKLDAVISGFALGAGFSVVENIIYLIRLSEYGAGTWLVRGLGTAVMHGTTLAILAATAHEFAERETRQAASDYNFNLLWFVPGYFAAALIHLAFNQFPERPLIAMLGISLFAPVAILGIFQFGTTEAERWLKQEYGEHKAQLQVLRAGRFPDNRCGKRVAALAERLSGAAAERIRRYWEVQTWLVAEAEETLIEEEEGDAAFDGQKIRDAFAELDGLKRAMGPTTFAQLNRLLPFSRNDYWELSELRQRVTRG
ncbi:MAG TPA: PrsW family glutamic-type intramembrane protease [Sphingomicrobium sp.]